MASNKSAASTPAARDQAVLSRFIVLEGLDGAGTTTQAARLVTALRASGHEVVATAEPTDGPIGRRIRSVLSGAERVADLTMALLFAADRSEHLADPDGGIHAELARGRYVVCDRYLFSSLAYQGGLCGFDYVRMLNSRFALPEHLVFLDLPGRVGLERIKTRGHSEIYETPEFQDTVYRGYRQALEYYAHSAMRIHRIDGSRNPHAVAAEILGRLAITPAQQRADK